MSLKKTLRECVKCGDTWWTYFENETCECEWRVEMEEDDLYVEAPKCQNAVLVMRNILDGDGFSKGNARWKTMDVDHYCLRAIAHIKAYMRGEREDEDSGANPLAHAMARCALVIEREILNES